MRTQLDLSTARPPRLRIILQHRRHVVLVPPEWAGDLRIYLHANGIVSGAPESADGDCVRVALAGCEAADAVQELLDQWDTIA